jgi:FkbM family methyltransferase
MAKLPLATRLRYLGRKIGLDVHRFSLAAHPDPLIRFLSQFGIQRVLDVGANEGQFGAFLRSQGYHGQIVSFEPNPDAFGELSKLAARDNAWDAWNVGLGSQQGQMTMNVAEYSPYSSLLKPTTDLLRRDQKAQLVGQQVVFIDTLDAMCESQVECDDRTLLKIDTQGYELPILRGASTTLRRVCGVQLEISVRNIYHQQPLIEEIMPHMRSLGFAVYSLHCNSVDRQTGELLEVDGIFFRPR